MTLPDYNPIVSWEVQHQEFQIKEHPHSLPPMDKHPDGRLIVDWYVESPIQFGLPTRAILKLWKREDHPNLSSLPSNAPRVVKSLYKKEGQIKLLRNDYIPVYDALEAWEKYLKVLGV